MRGVVEGWMPVLAMLTAMLSGILALSEYRGWPAVLFASGALLCLLFLFKRPRRPVVKVIAALVGTATLVLGGLSASYAVLGLPLNADDLERTCSERASHPRSSSLSAQSVTRVFVDVGIGFSHRSDRDQRPVGSDGDLTEVQRVACLSRSGSGEKLNTCPYGKVGISVFTLTLYQGIWQMDVREARTGRTLAVLHLGGTTATTCPSMAFVRNNQNPTSDYTEPTAADVLAALAER